MYTMHVLQHFVKELSSALTGTKGQVMETSDTLGFDVPQGCSDAITGENFL
jgi:hypothetical protein